MDSAWRADLFKFAMHRTVDIAYGSKEKRQRIINSDTEFVIINYDGVEIVQEAIANGGFDLIVVDEANAYKNAQTARWKTLNRLLKPDTWLWMLTGTPAAQSPVDAYGLAKLVNPQNVPRFFGSFKDMVMYKISKFKWVNKPNADKVVFEALQPAIRFTKDECLDLPELIYTTREVELTAQQKKYYDTLRKRLVMQAVGEQVTAINAAVGLSKLLQISCGAVYSDSGETLEFDIQNRYKVLREVIDETQQKILIFVPFKNTIKILTKKLIDDGFSTEIINGDVTASNRADIFKRFQESPNPRILIIQPQAAAHGVTLTAADTIVWWGPTPSLEIYAQANARAHRAGQKHPVTVVRLQGSNAEKHLYKMLDNRITDHSKLVELYNNLLDKDKV
jgi:SNF2 family DNA or RNA helicase